MPSTPCALRVLNRVGMLADWFSMWTVLADFLGPESLVFSLLEGGSDDGR